MSKLILKAVQEDIIMASCFFTYAWEEDEKKENQLNNILSRIKNKIEAHSDYGIIVSFDRESFKEGENFIEREQQIKNSDCVLLFLSPAYKEKITTNPNSGVYREYTMLKERALSAGGGVMPILLSGTRETAVPDEFKNIIYWDLSKYKNPKSVDFENYIDKLAQKAVRKAYGVSFCKNPKFFSIDEEYKALFLESSANSPLPSECIIKTVAHDKIINQSTCFVIGRKGSGKSTLLNTIQRYDPIFYQKHYKKLVSIDAETLDISFIYNNLVDKVKKEFKVLNMQKVLDTFWEVLLVLQSMVTIGYELEYFEITRDDCRYEVFKQITNRLKKFLGINNHRFRGGLLQSAICHCAVELVEHHIHNNLLDRADELTPLTAAYSNLDSFIILSNVFGKDLFFEYCLGVSQCRKKILLALDGFDTHSEDFRRATSQLATINKEEFQFRADYEVQLFRELMVVIHNIKRKRVQIEKQHFFNAVHFCIILPQDRYDQISIDDRDIEKREICSLNWDAYDLMEMLVKRLEYHFNIEPPSKKVNLKERFYSILQEKLPNIPMQVNISINGYPQRIPLFNYLLRHTFWRPRDIIKNFAIIMKLSKDSDSGRDVKLTQSIIKMALSQGAKRIIEGEFINEYKNIYINIKDVLLQFRTNNFMQNVDEFCEKLLKINIQTAKLTDFSDVESKLRLLYKLGVIGLYAGKDDADNYWNGYSYCYSFTEGLDPIDDFLIHGIPNKTPLKIVFNPIFIKYLSLNVNTQEQICDYPWEYLETIHELKDDIRRI